MYKLLLVFRGEPSLRNYQRVSSPKQGTIPRYKESQNPENRISNPTERQREFPGWWEGRVQDSNCAAGLKDKQFRLEGIRRVKERFLQEDETNKIPDASKHIKRRFRQLVKMWVLNQRQLNRKINQGKKQIIMNSRKNNRLAEKERWGLPWRSSG